MNFQEDIRFPMSRCDDELVADWLLFNIVGILRYLYLYVSLRLSIDLLLCLQTHVHK